MTIPPVSRYMTRAPLSVGPRDRLASARALMSAHEIHHLPVIEDNRLVGLLRDQDLRVFCDPEDHVADAMTRDVTEMSDGASLDEVIGKMEAQQLDSVVLVGRGQVQGIFTLADAMRAFCDVLRRE